MNPEKEIVLKKKNGLFIGIFISIWVLGVSAMIIIMLNGLFFDNHDGHRIPDYLTFVIIGIFLWIIFTQLALWNLNGRNILRFYENRITIQNAGALFHMKEKAFFIRKPLRVEIRDIKNDMLWAKNYGMAGDKLIIKGYDGHRSFGQGLKTKEAQKIANEMNQYIAKRAD